MPVADATPNGEPLIASQTKRARIFEGQTQGFKIILWLCVLCLIKLKMTYSYRNTWVRGSVVAFGVVLPEFESQELSFCWNGYWARAIFKHSEAKWRQLPWLRSETLFPLCRLLLQCTKVERSSRALHERSFANLQAIPSQAA